MKSLLATLCAIFAASPAAAATTGGIPQAQVGVIKNKLFHTNGRVEVGLSFATAVGSRFTQSYGGLLAVDYNFNEWLGLELDGAYNATSLSDLAQKVRDKLPKIPSSSDDISKRQWSEMSQMGQMKWNGGLAVRFAPVYGKVSVFAELPVHYQFYALAGGGVAGMHYESLTFCVQHAGAAQCDVFRTEDGISPNLQLGLGMRIFLLDQISLKFELRDFLYADKYRQDFDQSQGSKCVSDLSSPSCGTAANTGFLSASTLLFTGGVAFLF